MLDLPFDRQLTVDDWFALPETPERYELYEGVLVLIATPSLRHQSVIMALSAALFEHAIPNGGAAYPAPTGVALAQFVGFEPDIVYLANDRLHLQSERGIEGAPTIVVEVASPGTRRFDLTTKLPAYFRYGVLEVWIADPVRETVRVYFADEPNAPLTVPFGEQIPSRIVDVGNARLNMLPRIP
jgi:Uma2 family endonuclease